MSDPKYIVFNKDDTRDILQMISTDPSVKGAFEIGLRHLCVNKMTVEYDGAQGSQLMNAVWTQYWTEFARAMWTWYKATGFCLYTIVSEKIKIFKDDIRMEKYGEVKGGYVTCKVPVALPLEYLYRAAKRSYGYKVDVVCLNERKFEPDVKIKVLMQRRMLNFDDRYHSVCGVLLGAWRHKNESERAYRNVEFSMANPPIFLQHSNPTDLQQMTELKAIYAETHQIHMAGDTGYYVKKDGEAELSVKSTNDKLYEKMHTQESLLDRGDNFITIPTGYNSTSSVPMPVYIGNIQAVNDFFDSRLALNTGVPHPYFHNTIGGNSVAKVTDEEQRILAEHTALDSQDITVGIKYVWLNEIYPDDDPELLITRLPVTANVTLDVLESMFERGFINGKIAREEALRIHHIDESRLGDFPPRMKRFIKKKPAAAAAASSPKKAKKEG